MTTSKLFTGLTDRSAIIRCRSIVTIHLRALTWDDPRGRGPIQPLSEAFEKTTAGRDVKIEWKVQPLGGFESASLAVHAEQFDLIIIDHPHVIEAAAAGAIAPFELASSECYVGPCLASYCWREKLWAVPVDAASHVAAYRAINNYSPPATWDSFFDQARQGVRFALPLFEVHALMATLTLLASLGTAFDANAAEQVPGTGLPSDRELTTAFELLFRIKSACLPESLHWNPIQALDAMADEACDCLPLTFGYAHFQDHGIRFSGIPAIDRERSPRPILGGTGIAVSARRPYIATASELARFAGSRLVQTDLWPRNGGQPAHFEAWQQLADSDPFYRDTSTSLDNAYVRPRCLGWNQFQSAAGAAINHWLASGATDASTIVDHVKKLWHDAARTSRPPQHESSTGVTHDFA